MKALKPESRLRAMLSCLTILFILGQLAPFTIHYHVSDILNSFTDTSIFLDLLHSVVLLPLAFFVLIQIAAYLLLICLTWWIAISVGEFFKFSASLTYWSGIVWWVLACGDVLALNSYYFPHSFFAIRAPNSLIISFLLISALLWLNAIVIAYFQFFYHKHYRKIGWLFLLLGVVGCFAKLPFSGYTTHYSSSEPNIILIGVDSVRPDFTGYFGHHAHTPAIDLFLSNAVTFKEAYTPLGRTFPAWISILTAKYPKNSFARNNLPDPSKIIKNETLAKRLQQAGYHTIYASDEKRFSNITKDYGFDQLIGPSMGVNDFILGSLSDFPLTNLLTKLPFAATLFPYNYSNRAAAVTYDPEHFIPLLKNALANRPNKPLFLAVHLCLSHWPFTWARDHNSNMSFANQYKNSVEGVDKQVGEMLSSLKQLGLLDNSIVVLLSDHGTGLGLPGDTLLDEKNYHGNKNQLKMVPIARLSFAPIDSIDFKHDYARNTSYGQGTNLLSLQQSRVLLAFKRYGNAPFKSQEISAPVSLLDIAPTLLAALNMPPLKKIDGISLAASFHGHPQTPASHRILFFESGDYFSEIETDHIYIEKVIQREAGLYHINPHTGLLTMDEVAAQSINAAKQRAVLQGDWVLARYPASTIYKLMPANNHSTGMMLKPVTLPPYFILANIRSGQWTVGLNTAFAQAAPINVLTRELRGFYGSDFSR